MSTRGVAWMLLTWGCCWCSRNIPTWLLSWQDLLVAHYIWAQQKRNFPGVWQLSQDHVSEQKNDFSIQRSRKHFLIAVTLQEMKAVSSVNSLIEGLYTKLQLLEWISHRFLTMCWDPSRKLISCELIRGERKWEKVTDSWNQFGHAQVMFREWIFFTCSLFFISLLYRRNCFLLPCLPGFAF